MYCRRRRIKISNPICIFERMQQQKMDGLQIYHRIIECCILCLYFLFLTTLAWRCENLFAHQYSPFPSYSPDHCAFNPVEPCYGVILYEDHYLLLLLAPDLRMDPTLRPIQSLRLYSFTSTSGTLTSSTTRLKDGIFTVHQFSVAISAQLHQSESVF
jgi:hypothetical protein